MRRVKTACLLSLLAMAIIVSCAGRPTEVASTPAAAKVKRVAVLPFANVSGKGDAGDIVTNLFIVELFKTGRFQVEEAGNISQFMIHEKVNVIGEMDMDKLQILGARFGVDAVLIGRVEEFDDGSNTANAVPVLSVTVRMVDPQSGHIIWSAQHKRAGSDYTMIFDFGTVRSVSALAKNLIKEMIATIH
ncbi:MAG: hypothetical protein HY886_05630 [Deltaproteobacteria bacterium]|nr:hypothetical protein [Deltaproteobacteria bacterium]